VNACVTVQIQEDCGITVAKDIGVFNVAVPRFYKYFFSALSISLMVWLIGLCAVVRGR